MQPTKIEKEVRNHSYRGGKIIITPVKDTKRYYDCLIKHTIINFPIFKGKSPNILIRKAKALIDMSAQKQGPIQTEIKEIIEHKVY